MRRLRRHEGTSKTFTALRIIGGWNGLTKQFDKATATAADLQGVVTHMQVGPLPSPAPSKARKAL